MHDNKEIKMSKAHYIHIANQFFIYGYNAALELINENPIPTPAEGMGTALTKFFEAFPQICEHDIDLKNFDIKPKSYVPDRSE